MAKFSKFIRPETPSRGIISDRDLDIIEVVLRYRFSTTSELLRLVGRNHDVTQRRLRKMWEWGLVNRFAFPGFRTQSEFVYCLDNRQALSVLAQHGRLSEIHRQLEDELRQNREADYAGAAMRGQHMKLGFLQHALMIKTANALGSSGFASLPFSLFPPRTAASALQPTFFDLTLLWIDSGRFPTRHCTFAA